VLALVVMLGVDTLELAKELLADEDDARLAQEPSCFLLFFVWRRRDDLRLSADVESMAAKIIPSNTCCFRGNQIPVQPSKTLLTN